MTRGTENSINTSVGGRGSMFVSDDVIRTSTDMIVNSVPVSSWTLIHCIVPTQFETLVDESRSTASNDITDIGVTFPTGAVIGGRFTSVKLRSGTAVYYV